MNTLLSLGSLNGNTVTCPFHAAQFDVTTGQKVKEPSLVVNPIDKLPQDWKNFVDHIYKLNLKTKTYDQEAYKLVIGGDSINVSFNRNFFLDSRICCILNIFGEIIYGYNT
jgi:nitrite reductase/ring-hydroxylating ferredoxin subunit